MQKSVQPAPRGLTSTSMDRAPGSKKDFVRGRSGGVPFWPGGMEDILSNGTGVKPDGILHQGLKTVPPGFKRGLRLPGEEVNESELLGFGAISTNEHGDQKVR
jgi:antiviral helicase SKI2